MQVTLLVTLQEMLEILGLSYILILQKFSFVHNTSSTAHVSESAWAALDPEKQ